jgi:signal transduction histidine kinase
MLVCIPPIVVAVAVQLRLRDAQVTTDSMEQTVFDIDELRDTLTEADTALRFLAILGFDDQEYVDMYQAAVDAVPGELAAIERGLPAEMAPAMAEVKTSTEAQVEEMAHVIDYVSPTSTDGPPATSTDGPPTTPTERPSDDDVINEKKLSLLEELILETRATQRAYESVEALEGLANQQLSVERAAVERLEVHLVWATLAGLTVGMLAVAGGLAFVATAFVRRIEQLSENGRRFLRSEPLLPTEASADEIGQLTNNIVFMSEVLDQRRREAVAATRAKDEFLGRISHEMRTPLTGIIGFGELLEDDDLPPESLDIAGRIVRAGHHLVALIDELLDIARIEAGQINVSVEPVALAPVVRETIALVQSMAATHSLKLTSECPDGLLVTADRRRLTQILINLLSNAIKYNRPEGSVHVAATSRGDTVRISVTDTGPGISDDNVELLFRPFARLGAEDTGIEGSGIGLALTKTLVEAMGGTIGVDTELGRGTTFWVDLPAAATPMHEQTTATGGADAGPEGVHATPVHRPDDRRH